MMRRYAAVAIAALVLTLVYMYSGEDTPAPLPPELADEPDVYIEDAAITKFAADGGVRYRLWADRIKQFDERSVTYFDNPVIRLSQQVGPPWQARAARGEIRQRPVDGGTEEEHLYLAQSVKLTRQYGEGRRFALTTAALDVYPERQYAATDQAVMIETSGGKTTASGFEADMERGWMKLLSVPGRQVHGVIEPD